MSDEYSPVEYWFDLSQMWVGTFFYGIYVVLFCLCMYILLNRPRNLANNILVAFTLVLFALSTVQTVMNIVLCSADIDLNLLSEAQFDRIDITKERIYIANNIIADSLMIYRCYIIWNRKIYIIVLPTLMVITTGILGYDPYTPFDPFFAVTLATNLLVTVLTAGRIWWICRQVRTHLKTDTQKRFVSSMAIIIESGLLYPVGVMLFLILGSFKNTTLAQEPLVQMLSQLVGIVPTLIIVRVGLGLSVQSVQTTVAATSAHSLDSDTSIISSRGMLKVPPAVHKGSHDLEKGLPRPADATYGPGKF